MKLMSYKFHSKSSTCIKTISNIFEIKRKSKYITVNLKKCTKFYLHHHENNVQQY